MAAAVRGVSSRHASGVVSLQRSLLFCVALLCIATVASAGTFTAYGPQQFTRTTGAPAPVTAAFAAPASSAGYVLRLDANSVSSAVVSLNGQEIFVPRDFNHQVVTVERAVTLLAQNQLSVELRGKPGESFTLSVLAIDNDNPVVTATATPAPNGAGWNNSDVTVSFDCSDALSGVESCPGTTVVTTEGAAQVISGIATDGAGNTAAASVTLNIDKTAPALTVDSPSEGATVPAQALTVSGTIADALSGVASVTCNGGAGVVAGAQFTCSVAIAPGANTITVVARDVAGNSRTATRSVQAGDILSVRITEPANFSFVNISPVTVRGTVNQPGATVAVGGIAAPVSNGTFAVQVPLVEGFNTLTAVAQSGGSAAATGSVQVTLDTTAPHVAIYAPADGFATADASINVSGLVNDIVVGTVNDQEARVTVNGVTAEVANRNFLATNVPLAMGDNAIQVTARDRVGNAYTASEIGRAHV